jgi:predicted nucleic acid-binding protein
VNAGNVVVDTSIFLRFLLRQNSSGRRRFVGEQSLRFFCPRFFFVELLKHKEKIVQASELAEDELLQVLHSLLAKIRFVEEGSIPIGVWMKARRLCESVDLKDTPFVALALHLDASLWTSDAELRAALVRNGFDRFTDI